MPKPAALAAPARGENLRPWSEKPRPRPKTRDAARFFQASAGAVLPRPPLWLTKRSGSNVRRVKLRTLTLDELTIDDERSFRHVALYDDLKQALRRDGYRFRVPEGDASWDRAALLEPDVLEPDEHGDLIAGDHLAADVVAHVAWHHLPTARSRPRAAGAPPSAESLLLAEAIASAFDLYLVGRLLGHAPSSDFLGTQVPAMAEAAEAAGLSDAGFEALLESVSADPERAFEDLRALLFDVTTALVRCDRLSRAAGSSPASTPSGSRRSSATTSCRTGSCRPAPPGPRPPPDPVARPSTRRCGARRSRWSGWSNAGCARPRPCPRSPASPPP